MGNEQQTATIVQLDDNEAIEARAFFLACDAQIEGFRLGIEVAKRMKVEELMRKRKNGNGNQPQAPPPSE